MSFEAIPGGTYGLHVLSTLAQGRPLKGATYNNIILSSSKPDIVDDITARSLTKFVTIFWPGGSPEHGDNLETIAINEPKQPLASQVEKERMWTRVAILSAHIGETAINRVPAEIRESWSALEAAHTERRPVDFAIDACVAHELPLAVCTTSDITDGEPGTRIMHLFYPSHLHPEPVLSEVQLDIIKAYISETPLY